MKAYHSTPPRTWGRQWARSPRFGRRSSKARACLCVREHVTPSPSPLVPAQCQARRLRSPSSCRCQLRLSSSSSRLRLQSASSSCGKSAQLVRCKIAERTSSRRRLASFRACSMAAALLRNGALPRRAALKQKSSKSCGKQTNVAELTHSNVGLRTRPVLAFFVTYATAHAVSLPASASGTSPRPACCLNILGTRESSPTSYFTALSNLHTTSVMGDENAHES